MALITDPDQLNQGTEVTYDTAGLTIALALAGNLSEDGVTGQCLYSFSKEEWLNDANLIKFTFPMLAITPEQFEFGANGSKFSNWKPLDDATRKLVRTAGWREYDNAGANLREYVGVITLGNIDATSKTVGDKVKYAFASDTATTDMTYAGPANEAVQIYGDATNGNFDKRSEVFTVYVREENKTYGSSTTTSIGTTTLTYNVQRFPLSEGTDLKADVADTGIDADTNGTADVAPYDSMSITYIDHANQGIWTLSTVYVANDVVQSSTDGRWYITAAGGTSAGDDTDLAGGSDTGVTWVSFTGERQIGSTWYAFGVIIDGNSGTAEQIYEFVQWSLRQTGDIDAGAGTQVGTLAEDLLVFVGDTLRTLQQSDGDGTYIDNFNANDTNRLEFQDDLFAGTARTFPFVAAGTITFNTNIVNDTGAKYWMFFKDANGNLIDSAAAIIVDDNGGTDITGDVTGAASIAFDFDYDGNVQGGRTAGTDAVVVLRVMGLNTTQYVEAEFTITRATGLNFPMTGVLERNYLNAA